METGICAWKERNTQAKWSQRVAECRQSARYQQNLKRAVATMNFITKHGIGSCEKLVERYYTIAAPLSTPTRESLRDTERRIANLALLGKRTDTYRKL